MKVSIHAPLARGDKKNYHNQRLCEVSIHAPLARGDRGCSCFFLLSSVSIHAPLARGDLRADIVPENPFEFQSTPLLRGATAFRHRLPACFWRFNPRPSCEGRRYSNSVTYRQSSFNPRPSCEGRPLVGFAFAIDASFNPRPSCEGRHFFTQRWTCLVVFQSTPLLRGATAGGGNKYTDCNKFQSTPLLRGATGCTL